MQRLEVSVLTLRHSQSIARSMPPSAPCSSSGHSRIVSALVDSRWNVMGHGDIREGKWRGNWRMEWVASTLHTTSEHCVSSITTADAHTSAASSRMNWRPLGRFKWTRPFRRKTKSGFCACTITFQLACNALTQGTTCDKTAMWWR